MTNRPATQRRLATHLYDEALREINGGRWHDASVTLRRVLDTNPDYPGASRQLDVAEKWRTAEACYRLGRHAAGERRWRDAHRFFVAAEAEVVRFADASFWKRVCESELRRELEREQASPTLTLEPGVYTLVGGSAILLCAGLSMVTVPALTDASRVALRDPTATTVEFALLGTSTPVPTEPNTDDTAASPDPMAAMPEETQNQPTPVLPAPPFSTATVRAVSTTRTVRATNTPARRATPTRTPARVAILRTATPPNSPPTSTSTFFAPPPATSAPTATQQPVPELTATPTPAGGIAVIPTSSSPTATRVPPTPTATVRPSPTPKWVTVHASEYRFSPSEMSVQSGARVRITLDNDGNMTHEWTLLSGTGSVLFKLTAAPGQTATGEFAAPAAGTYTFACTILDHAANGMRGTLFVQ